MLGYRKSHERRKELIKAVTDKDIKIIDGHHGKIYNGIHKRRQIKGKRHYIVRYELRKEKLRHVSAALYFQESVLCREHSEILGRQ